MTCHTSFKEIQVPGFKAGSEYNQSTGANICRRTTRTVPDRSPALVTINTSSSTGSRRLRLCRCWHHLHRMQTLHHAPASQAYVERISSLCQGRIQSLSLGGGHVERPSPPLSSPHIPPLPPSFSPLSLPVPPLPSLSFPSFLPFPSYIIIQRL